MKWLLVNPPSNSSIQKRLGPVGLPSASFLAPILEEENEEVKILCSNALNLELNDVEAEVKKFNPDFVGISSLTPTIYKAYEVAEVAKKVNPNSTIVIGGPHPTFMARETLEECPAIDIAVRGEGEETIRELVSSRDLKNVKGITYRRGDKIMENEDRPLIKDLDSLPFPSYHLLPLDKYRLCNSKYATMMTSRGCPYNCIFCSSSGMCGKTWRGKSPERVIKQINLLVNEHGIREIEMLDDTFVLDKSRAMKIADLIIEEDLDISWSCSSRVDTITKPLAEKLGEAGCHTIYMGIESGSQEILNRLRKGITLKQIKKAVKKVKDVRLNVVGSFILGVSGEMKKQMEKTVEFAKKLGLTLAQFTLFTPYPGTEAFKIAKEYDLLLTKDWSKYTTLDPVMKVPGMTPGELKSFLRKAYISFYLRPSYIWESIKEGRFQTFLNLLGRG